MKTLTKIFFTAALLLSINIAFADTQDRHLTGFTSIQLSASYDVYISQGSTESVRVEAPGKAINKILTEVQGGTLKIYSKSQSGWGNWFSGDDGKMAVYVTVRDINGVFVSGSGNVYFKNGIKANNLKIRVSGSGDVLGKIDAKIFEVGISGSGDIKLSGKAEIVNASVSGSGDYSARGLYTLNTAIRVSGSGDASVYATQKIDASVSGSGDIRYGGSPKQVSTSTHGSGEIHRM